MRLIDAEAVFKNMKSYEKADENWICTGGTAIKLIHKAINDAPAVDAVEVVRCKDCKYYDECTNFLFDDEYCSRGEHK